MNYLEKYFKKKKRKKIRITSLRNQKKNSPPPFKNKEKNVGKIKERYLDFKNINNEYKVEKKKQMAIMNNSKTSKKRQEYKIKSRKYLRRYIQKQN